MKIIIIGGNGLLGSYTASEALQRGHKVTILSRKAGTGNVNNSEGIRFSQGNVYELSSDELKTIFEGHDAVVYSYNIDDREIQKRPAYEAFHYDHVTVCEKVLLAAKNSGVQKFIVFGSYFTYFNEKYPELKLADKHCYIKTRCEQRDMILHHSSDGFKTYVLELPYILGVLPGKVPPWTLFLSMLSGKGRQAVFFKKGGTAAVTAGQVGNATINIIEGNQESESIPLCGVNLSWTDIANTYFELTRKPKTLIQLPVVLFKIFGIVSSVALWLTGKERGLSVCHFADLQYHNTFIDPEISNSKTGISHENYNERLKEVIEEWISINKRNG